jgi:hypothetical protein
MLFTPKGNISSKPIKGRSWRSYLRMEIVARLEATGMYSNDQIAHFIGVHVQTLIYMKARPEYQRMRISFATGVLDTVDKDVRLEMDNQIAELKDMVPFALRTLRDTLIRGNSSDSTLAERKLALEASRDVMDREGTFAKVSRAEVKVSKDVDLEKEKQVQTDLLAMLSAADAAKRTNDTSILDAFVNSSGSKDVQEQMKKNINLEDFKTNGKPN